MKDLAKESSNKREKKLTKQMFLDLIKFLLILLIVSILFHEKVNAVLTSFSDFAFHHYFISSFFILLFLSITIEFEIFNGSHFKDIRNRFKSTTKPSSEQKTDKF